MDFSLQNAAATKSAAQYVRFNQIFAEGDLPQGQSLSAVIGTKTVPLQMDVLSRYADGSVKSAILTVAAPSIAAATTLQANLVTSGATVGTAIATDAALAHGYDLKVNMNISGLGSVTINAAQKLAGAVAAGDFEVLRQGVLATEIRFDVAVTRALRVTFDVVTYADGSVSTKVSFQNDAAMGAVGGAVLFNSLSMVEGGTTRFSTTNLTQYQFQVWAQDVTQDSSAKQTLNVRHDIDYLERTGAIWNYDLTAKVGAASPVPSDWTNVLGENGVTKTMAAAGERPDIGPTTEANARWLITQDASAATYALAQDQAAGSVPWHYYDTAKGHYLSVADYPELFIDYRGAVQPRQLADDASGWIPDRAHTPDLSYVAWLLTGDRYHLDMLNAQASWVIGNTWNAYRENEKGIVTHRDEEMRAQAWALRTVQEAAFANPDGSYEKAYFTRIANNNWADLRAKTAALTSTQGDVHGYLPGLWAPGSLAPWPQDYFASTSALGALQGNQDARAVLKWQANFLSGRFLSPDMNPYNGFIYRLDVGDSSGKLFTTWAEVEAETKAVGTYYATGPFAGPYAALAAMSNANIITVFAGGDDPTDHRVAADAMRAYGWILGSGMPDLRADAKYQVVPRMPDGTQIGVTEMRVVAPTTQNTSFSFTGDNVFAYDRGVGRTTLNGTAGSDVMIDNSTNGGDRLAGKGGDDYLIGGVGTNVFAPGDGRDYVLIRGRAASIEVSAASAGRLEIEGFRPGTDIISLTGVASLASILASARTDGFGGTLLTISPNRTIRLNGLAPSRITGSMFDLGGLLPPFLGTPGADTLTGTLGADTMLGGAGNDIYIVNSVGDSVVELAGQGTDTVRSSVSYALASNVERLTLTGTGSTTATGNSLANVLTGNAGNNTLSGAGGADTINGGAGNDTISGATGDDAINGGAGNDKLNGGAGADVMFGGAGNDSYAVDHAGDVAREDSVAGIDDGGTGDIVQSSVSFTLGAFIEHLTLTGSAAIDGTGNDLANRITGNGGANQLYGLGGNDILAASGGGADDLDGGQGSDTYYVDNADTARDTGTTGTDTVVSTGGFTLGAGSGIENLQLKAGTTNKATLTGDAMANRLTGNDGTNTLRGLGGNDTLMGGLGNDRLQGGLGRDLLVGGGGADVFVVNTGDSPATASPAYDTVNDFATGIDRIDLDTIIGAGLVASAYAEVAIGSDGFGAALNAATSAMADGRHRVVFVAGSTDGWLLWNTDGNPRTPDQAVRLAGQNSLADFAATDVM